ncbi:uncharacterized protein LOC135698540 [Ochlerotatus camptorhynchus]|uniref:uncharacterized protein LOC135698540 n=1 Tax=Ochlerotatus camptorhynchus TaxID=644619 RepID=UPI0031DAF076
MKSALLVLAVILGCNGQGYQGYYYPKPSIPLEPAPVCSTSYVTQTLREAVQVPVYYTSTVVDRQYFTVFSTVVQPVTQIETQTRTVVITPSPVILYSTIVSTVTAFSGIQDDSSSNQQSLNNGYLPPPVVSDDARGRPNNEYLPPCGEESRSNTGVNILSLAGVDSDAVSQNSVRFNPLEQQQISLNLGALPPY